MASQSSDYFFDRSQSLFPDSQQVFSGIGSTPPPLFTQDKTNKRSFNPPSKIQSDFCARSNSRNTTKPDNSNQGFCIPASPIPQPELPKFRAPFSQHTVSQKVTGNGKLHHFPSTLAPEALSRVENFINKRRSFPAASQSQKKTWQAPKTAPIDLRSPPAKKEKLMTVPETPFVVNKKIAASEESFDLNLDDSDEEDRGAIFGPSLRTPSCVQLPPKRTPGGRMKDGVKLRPIEEIPDKYRSVFNGIPCFNVVQSKVFEDALYTNKPLVVCAPTGSGKTVIFELAIVRMLVNSGGNPQGKRKGGNSMSKVVYMAPIKALCTERHEDWSRKFSPLGLECQELTGDSDIDDFWQLQKADIILTTPEKWDSMTRRWRDNTSLVRRVHLFLIDEVHLLNDEARGATMEAVVSRMKTVQSCTNAGKDTGLRFVAVSATIPNTEDIAEWLGTSGQPAVAFDMDESYRPVNFCYYFAFGNV
uniref:ATP-dependent DNA helicase MER3-like n=1 Tax=Ciona intestinalis TaxID=7719 RepID=UPI000EF4DA64|nr:ATP-dependent DNA helicase MER3-like [Ciona intestinalis]|eukprot:XP_026695104.1 ATP-dependent DNA helicase MER3-like [Ciona intestinalis]